MAAELLSEPAARQTRFRVASVVQNTFAAIALHHDAIIAV